MTTTLNSLCLFASKLAVRYCCVAALCGSLLSTNRLDAAATALTWTGGGVAGDWDDVNNWDGVNAPVDNTWQAVFPNGTGPLTLTTDLPGTLNRIQTGDSKITLTYSTGGNLNINAGSSFTPNASLSVGAGGLEVNRTLFFNNGGNTLTFAGDFKAPGFAWGNNATITQTGGAFDVTNFTLPLFWIGNPTIPIGNWIFAGTSSNAINGPNSTNPGSAVTFVGSPTTIGPVRLNWNVQAGTSNIMWDLNGHTMTGDVINVRGTGTPFTRFAYLSDTLGGTIDANSLNVAVNGYLAAYLNLHNTQVTLRGSGLIYNNVSINNAGGLINVPGANGGDVTPVGAYSIDDGTTFTFNPTAGAASIDTGSTDAGLGGFTNNFAFNNVTIAAGDVITLVGNQNVGGSANNALYVNGTLRGENLSQLALNSHNAYVNGGLEIGNGAGKFSVSGGGNLAFTSNATLEFEINGAGAGTGYDQLTFSGNTLSLNGATLDLTLNSTADGLYFLIDNLSGNAIDGTFSGLLQGANIDTGNPNLIARISYQGDFASNSFLGGNDLVIQLSMVPEPSTLMLFGLGAASIVATRRRQLGRK